MASSQSTGPVVARSYTAMFIRIAGLRFLFNLSALLAFDKQLLEL